MILKTIEVEVTSGFLRTFLRPLLLASSQSLHAHIKYVQEMYCAACFLPPSVVYSALSFFARTLDAVI